MFAQMEKQAEDAILERRDLEAIEGGRRQRDGFEYPKGGGEENLARSHAEAHHY